MQIWVDADACPNAVREILFRAAGRLQIPLILVANKILQIPASPNIRAIRVGAGFDAADKAIVREMESGDLVITADIPLAAEVIGQGGHALNPRGEFYSRENIAERLTMRNFMDELRDAGVNTGGPAALGRKDLQAFANGLDRFLARQGRE
jgi:uncharacterized protein YaiI (UPF0178 family)